MTIHYRYHQPAPDPHGRSVFSLEIDGPQHPFVPVVEETLDVPDGTRPEQILETIYLRNETESAPLRPRRFEITSMFPGCLVHLNGHGWWLGEPVGFRPAPFDPLVLEGKTLYCGEVIDNFPRLVRVAPTRAGRGLVGVDGELLLTRRGVSATLEGTFGDVRIEAHPAGPDDGWEVLAFRAGGGSARERLRAGSLPGALTLAAEIASEALHRPLVAARMIAALLYRGGANPPTEGIPDRIVSPLYFDPAHDAIRAAGGDRLVYRFRDGLQGIAHDPEHPAADHIAVATRVGIHEQDRHRGLDFCKRRLVYLAGALWLAASEEPLDCGLLSEDMAMHPLHGPGDRGA
jgi:hypothetical protein